MSLVGSFQDRRKHWPHEVPTIRLLMLTGGRRNEIPTLRWEHVDLGAADIHITDGKTGARTVHLSRSAIVVLKALPCKPGNPWKIPGAKLANLTYSSDAEFIG